MCKELVKTDCQQEHGKQKRVAEEEDQSCDGICVNRDLERAGTNGQEWKTTAEDIEMENINNESERSNQVTWTPPHKGARGRRRDMT